METWRKNYEPPRIIYEGDITTRAGSPSYTVTNIKNNCPLISKPYSLTVPTNKRTTYSDKLTSAINLAELPNACNFLKQLLHNTPTSEANKWQACHDCKRKIRVKTGQGGSVDLEIKDI